MSDTARTPMDGLTGAGGSVLAVRDADVGTTREQRRRGRFVKLSITVWTLAGLGWLRALTVGDGASFLPLPSIDPFLLTIIIFFGLLIAMTVGQRAFGIEHYVLARGERGPADGPQGRETDLFAGLPQG